MGAKQSALSSACFLCWVFFPSSCSLCAFTINKLSKNDPPAGGGSTPAPDEEGGNSKLIMGLVVCCCCCCILLSIIAGGVYMHNKGSKKPKFIM